LRALTKECENIKDLWPSQVNSDWVLKFIASYDDDEKEEMNNFRKAITKLHSKSTTPTLTQRLMFAMRGMPSHMEESALSAPAASDTTCYGEIDEYKPRAV